MFHKKNAEIFLSCLVSLHPISIIHHRGAVWKRDCACCLLLRCKDI